MKTLLFSLLSISVLYHVFWEILADGESDWRNAVKSEVNKCLPLMSDETAAIFGDDEEYDNEEVRRFLTCLYTKLGYMENNIIKQNRIVTDINTYFQLEPKTLLILRDAVEFCAKYEVNDNDTPENAAGKFTNCLNSKKKTDL